MKEKLDKHGSAEINGKGMIITATKYKNDMKMTTEFVSQQALTGYLEGNANVYAISANAYSTTSYDGIEIRDGEYTQYMIYYLDGKYMWLIDFTMHNARKDDCDWRTVADSVHFK